MIFFNSPKMIATLSLSMLSAYSMAQEIADWAGFRKAAVSFTFDDSAPSHIKDAAPMFDSYGYKATFNVITSQQNLNDFKALAANGHEIASHSDGFPSETMPDDEISSSKTTINNRITQEYGCITLAYPNCKVPSETLVLQNYIAGRVCNGSWVNPQISDIMGKNGPANWAQVPAAMTGDEQSIKTTEDFTGLMQSAINQGGWVMFLTHGFKDKENGPATFSPTDIDAMNGALSWAKQKDADIWVAPMGHVAMYIKERNASKITAGASSATSMTFTLTHTIADKISKYNYPLSIRVKNSNNWTKVSATQAGKAISSSIKDGYIYFDAVPNGGNIVLSGGEGSSAPVIESSSSSANTFKGAIVVPGTIEAENYDVNAYADADGESDNTGYRSDDAGVVNAGSGYALGYTAAGDYFEYTLDVRAAGKYKVTVYGATGNKTDGNPANGSVTLSVGTSSVEVPVAAQGDWDTYSESSVEGLEISAGTQTLRLTINDSYLNVDWIKLECDGCKTVDPSSSTDKETTAISQKVKFAFGSNQIRYQVFDMNGHLLKSANAMAVSVNELWASAKAGLPNGGYILLFGEVGRSDMQSIRVSK